MAPAPNPFATHTFTAPSGKEDDVDNLEVCEKDGIYISCWEPDESEIAAIAAGDRIWLYLMANFHPPVALSAGRRPIGL